MRYRNRNRVKTGSYLVRQHANSYNHSTYGSAKAYASAVIRKDYTSTVIDEMEDDVTPGYFKKAKSGDLLPTRLLKVKREEREMAWLTIGGVLKITDYTPPKWTNNTFSYYGYPSIPNVWPQLITDHDINTIAQSAQARMASDGIDWATSTLELGKTISMITGLRKSILKLISDVLYSLRNRRFKSLSELYNAFSSAWLEGRFGWRILYYELMSINDYISHIGEGHKKFFAREKFENSKTIDYSYFVYDAPIISIMRKQEVTYKVKAKVGYVGIGDLSRPGSFNALNTAWEVIPFTVVLDMFFNFQDIILAWAPSSSRVKGYQPGSFLTIEKTAIASLNFETNGFKDRETVHRASQPGYVTQTFIERKVAPAHPFSFDFSPELRGLKKVDLFAFMGPIYKAFIKK